MEGPIIVNPFSTLADKGFRNIPAHNSVLNGRHLEEGVHILQSAQIVHHYLVVLILPPSDKPPCYPCWKANHLANANLVLVDAGIGQKKGIKLKIPASGNDRPPIFDSRSRQSRGPVPSGQPKDQPDLFPASNQ